LKANHQIIERKIGNNLENGEEYAGIIKISYHNLMLDKLILRTKERPRWHRSFLPQEVV